MISYEEAQIEINRIKSISNGMNSWESYKITGRDFIGLTEQLTDLFKYIYELRTEIESLKKKPVQRIVYRKR